LIEIEVFGAALAGGAVSVAEVRRLCLLAAGAAGLRDGHLAVEFVGPERIAKLNREHRGKPHATDVLSFPIDGAGARALAGGAPRELGDVLICPAHTKDLREAVVHGVLHLCGMDHERDQGQMLALQAELLRGRGD
jgi:probable rRNA maturation factor